MIDWLIRNALIVDGMGNPPFTGDREDEIAEAGNLGDRDEGFAPKAPRGASTPCR
jgi:N-acyl-D-aspartate/D-glutamate deacylase